MRRARVWAGVGLAVAAIAALLAWPWRLEPRLIFEVLNTAAPLPPNLSWRTPESASLRVLPGPVIDISGLRIADASGRERLASPAAELTLSRLRLLFGDIEIAQARLDRPSIAIDPRALASGLRAISDGARPGIARISLRGARLSFAPDVAGVNEKLGPLDADISWPSPAAALTLTASASWRGQKATLTGVVDAPANLAAAGSSPLTLAFESKPLKLTFSGRGNRGEQARLTGELALTAPSLKTAAAWLGDDDDSALPGWPGAIAGPIAVSSDAATLADGSLTLNGQKLEGSIDLTRSDGRWLTAATLACDRLDLDGLIGPPPALLSPALGWSRRPWAFRFDPDLDFDLRLSAGEAKWGPLILADAALAASRQRDSATFEALDATIAKGVANAEITVAGCDTGCRSHATVSLANADLYELLRPFGVNDLSGRATLKVDLSAEGDNAAALVASARGKASLKAEAGAVKGLNFEEALRRVQRQRPDLGRDFAVGRTSFNAARAELKLTEGHADIVEGHFVGPGVDIDASGAIDLVERAWRTRLAAVQANVDGKPSPDAATMTLDLDGPWSAPTLTLTDHSP